MDVRAATANDAEGIVDLNRRCNGDDTEHDVRSVLGDPSVGPALWAVAVDGGRVVACVNLLAAEWRFGTVALPIGNPEFVATDPDYRGRGLIRACHDLVHRWSAERGDLVQFIAGIPYFYRQFGYEYAVPFPTPRRLDPFPVKPPEGWSVRVATVDDIPAMAALQAPVQAGFELVMAHPEPRWRWLVTNEMDRFLLAYGPDGRLGGMARAYKSPATGAGGMGEVAVGSPEAMATLVNHIKPAIVDERPGTVGSAWLAGRSEQWLRPYALYVRVADAVALLDRLRPVLSARLAASPFASFEGRFGVSFYRHSVWFELSGGEVVEVTGGPGEQAPTSKGMGGVPPDLVATLIFGPRAARALEWDHHDVRLGHSRGLMDVLFPGVVADFLTY